MAAWCQSMQPKFAQLKYDFWTSFKARFKSSEDMNFVKTP